MAKKSKLDKCVRCREHHAIAGVYTGYYGVGFEGVKQIKGSFRARGYCLKCFLKRAKREGLNSAQREELRRKLERSKHANHHKSKGRR